MDSISPAHLLKNARFNNASLGGANLSGSTLTNAQFSGANLTKANLGSSACRGLVTNDATRFRRTRLCNGSIDNSDCPAGVEPCCQDGECPPRTCRTVTCNQNISTCVYTRNANGAPGIECPTPRQCCDGVFCGAGQKCCGGTCIANDECCTNGLPGCPSGQTCVGGSASLPCACGCHSEV